MCSGSCSAIFNHWFNRDTDDRGAGRRGGIRLPDFDRPDALPDAPTIRDFAFERVILTPGSDLGKFLAVHQGG